MSKRYLIRRRKTRIDYIYADPIEWLLSLTYSMLIIYLETIIVYIYN
jgi:hypothetical protein